MEYEFPFAGAQGVDAAAQNDYRRLLVVPARAGFIDQDACVLCWDEHSLLRERYLRPVPILTIFFAYGRDRSVSRDHARLPEQEEGVMA